MAELKAVELVNVKEPDNETEEKQMTLKPEFKWFTTDEFKELREGFKPTDNSEFVKEFCKKHNIRLEEKTSSSNTEQELITKYYRCYKCVKVNHGTNVFGTNSKDEYQKHWLSHGSGNGSCYPSLVDIKHYGWEHQGKDWEE